MDRSARARDLRAAGVVGGAIFLIGRGVVGLALIGAGVAAAGLSIFAFCGCKAATKGIFIVIKKCIIAVKKCFRRKDKES